MLDVGANVECRPVHLVQFALMGEVYSRRVLGVSRPRVAVLANGAEPSKGTALTRTAAAALERSSLRFLGYCEGHDLLEGEVDVVVTDGFTGNVALKTMEGTARAVGVFVKEALRSDVPSKIGALFAKGALLAMRKRVDWREVGGAPLVGVNGVAVISHGASDARAIANAIERACDAVRAHCTAEIAEAASRAAELLAASSGTRSIHGRRRKAPLEAS
jgi:glycerol-3-phosphate acyltransferase PlsX